MMILSATGFMPCDVTGRYPSVVNQTNHKLQMNQQHFSWLKSHFHGDRYNENTDGGSDGEEK
jgi:hypothetical protein